MVKIELLDNLVTAESSYKLLSIFLIIIISDLHWVSDTLIKTFDFMKLTIHYSPYS